MNASDFFKNLLALVKGDILTAGLKPAIAFLQAIETNPNPVNVTLQAGVLGAQLIATVPNLEQTVIQQLAAQLQTELASIQAGAVTATTAAAAAA